MPFCSSCGFKVINTATFCSACGNAILPEKENISSTKPELYSEVLVANKKTESSLANQVLLGFFFIVLCDLKGYHPTPMFEDTQQLIMYFGLIIIIMAVTYFCAIHQGINKSKPNFVMGITIFLTLLTVFGAVSMFESDSYLTNNFWDWFSFVISIGQVIGLVRIHFLIKNRQSLSYPG